jgi:CheY-like chemotaxis protein
MLHREVVILVVEDEQAHAELIERNLKRAGVVNEQVWFRDGAAVLDFLRMKGEKKREPGRAYLVLLDIRMPGIDGVEVLRQVKQDPELRRIPVIMVTTTDDPREVERCHELGCNSYVTKPVDYQQFVEAVRRIGLFLQVVEVPRVDGEQVAVSSH